VRTPLAWLSDLASLTEQRIPCVLVTVTETKGSTPREAGTKMVVSADRQLGTIGGGNLEFEAIAEARALLAAASQTPSRKDYALGPSLAQCCGGGVTVLLEPFLPVGRTIHLFGAGHVGKEIVRVLEGLAVRVRWVDERANEFPGELPSSVERVVTSTPSAEIRSVGPGDVVLILTHSHDLDYALVRAAYTHGQFGYLGLIGSGTKRARFEKRLLADGVSAAEIERMVCPIGVPEIPGKHPRAIAIAVAAQLLALP
jgi:xanthine dehydrogenase accessory factor